MGICPNSPVIAAMKTDGNIFVHNNYTYIAYFIVLE